MDFIIWNSKGHEIYSSIDQIHRVYIKECNSRSQKFECNIDGCKKRHGKVKNEDGSVYAITDNKDLVRSSKLFKKNLNLYLKLIDKAIKYRNDLATKYSDNISRILHNVITLTSQNMQEIYSLVPQNVLTSDLKDQLKTIRSHISSDLDESAKIMFRLIKNNILIKTEFQVYKTLNNPDQLLTKREHDLKKVVLNAFHAFFYDFKSKGIYVNIEDCNRKLNINYPTLTGALVHFIDNAAKYSMSDSVINVR